MPNSRSSRKTISRKSMDSAPKSPCRVEVGLISSSSTLSASTSVAETLAKISSWLGMLEAPHGKEKQVYGLSTVHVAETRLPLTYVRGSERAVGTLNDRGAQAQ